MKYAHLRYEHEEGHSLKQNSFLGVVPFLCKRMQPLYYIEIILILFSFNGKFMISGFFNSCYMKEESNHDDGISIAL